MGFLKILFRIILNTLLTIACIPLLFFCAYGLMLGTSATTSGFANSFIPTIWSLFGIMGIIAFFVTWFKKPKKILTVFIICGILAAIPIVYIGIKFLITNSIGLIDLELNLAELLQRVWESDDEKTKQRLIVSGVIWFAAIIAPLLFVLKALYVLYVAFRDKSKTA